MPGYAGLRVALTTPWQVARLIDEAKPDAIHIATEGPIGLLARRYCRKRGRAFTTSFHTRFPDYVTARIAVPESWVWWLLRRFHAPSRAVMAATPALTRELRSRGFRNVVLWSRGVDSSLFRPRQRTLDLPRPIFLSVGRLAREKNLEAFLDLDLPGTKVVVGDGPAFAALKRRYPEAVFPGALFGEQLAEAYASSDVFVFPSKTDTFGLVLLEALASGVPVAAFPVAGPRDVITDPAVGVLDDDLRGACLRALDLSRDKCRAFAVGHSWESCARNLHRPCQCDPDVGGAGSASVSKTMMSPAMLARWPRFPVPCASMDTRTTTAPVTPADIDAAAETIAPVAVRTPLLNSAALDERVGARVFLKPEVLQRTGSFKFRGAYNKLSSIPNERRAAGVVAFSSGNHAQGVAAAARLLNMPATIVMPADAPVAKRERTKSFGAEVVLYDRDKEDREAIARAICDKRGATLVPPYDDPKIVAGQGTVGREIAQDLVARGAAPDLVIAPASGGGLVAGVATAIKAKFPDAQVLTAEPEGFDDHARSFAAGRRTAIKPVGRTICDALMAPMPGEITFAVNHALGVRGVIVSDAEVGAAVKFAFNELKLVVEPGGAIALAALLAGRIEARGKTIAIVLSGGNVDADLFAKLIS